MEALDALMALADERQAVTYLLSLLSRLLSHGERCQAQDRAEAWLKSRKPGTDGTFSGIRLDGWPTLRFAFSCRTVRAVSDHVTPQLIQAEQKLDGCRSPSVFRRVREAAPPFTPSASIPDSTDTASLADPSSRKNKKPRFEFIEPGPSFI